MPVHTAVFSCRIELFPTKTTTAEETARYIHQLFGGWELPIDFEPTMSQISLTIS